jgi:hypothetical protein
MPIFTAHFNGKPALFLSERRGESWHTNWESSDKDWRFCLIPLGHNGKKWALQAL